MTGDIKKRLTQLVEINRALADDLDVSRRIVAEVGNERDALRARVEVLETEIEMAVPGDMAGKTSGTGESTTEDLSREWERALRGAEAATSRANLAEERLRIVAQRLCELEEERDSYKLKVDEMAEAMSEIRYRLAELPRSNNIHGLSF
jgi:chromosome segregation ATPase